METHHEYASYDNLFEPKLIEGLKNVIDAQSSGSFSVALCGSYHQHTLLIISNWCRLYHIPTDLLDLLVLYTKSTSVYSTTNQLGSGHPMNIPIENTSPWNKIELFETQRINIIKITISDDRSFFIDDTGVVWVCGSGYEYLGLGPDDSIQGEVDIPRKMKYFIERDIRIKDVQCGYLHNLALSVDGDIYAWGKNNQKQCGVETDDLSINIPRRIEFFDDHVVDKIMVGRRHNYVHTECGKNYLWGDNEDKGCIKFDDEKFIARPHQIDQIVKTTCDIEQIVDVQLGWYNTVVIGV